MVELLDDAVRCVHRAVAADNLCEEYSSLLMCCTLLNCLQRPAGGDNGAAPGAGEGSLAGSLTPYSNCGYTSDASAPGAGKDGGGGGGKRAFPFDDAGGRGGGGGGGGGSGGGGGVDGDAKRQKLEEDEAP